MKVKEWCKKHLNIVIFTILCLFSIIVYIQFVLGHYATDTYNIAQVGYDKYIKNWFLTDGRIFSAIFLFIVKSLKIPIECANIISILLAIAISNVAVVQIVKWTKKYANIRNIKGQIFLILICYIIIWNFMYVENMYFLESSVMALSILCYTMSAIKLVEKEKNYFLKSLIFAILGIISYQGTVGFFIVLTAFLTLIKNARDYKKSAIDIFKCGIIVGIAACVDFGIIKIVENVFGTMQTRLCGFSQIFGNIRFISMYTKDILKHTCNLYPSYLFIIFVITVIGIVIVNYIKSYKKTENESIKKVTIVFDLIVLVILSIISSSITFLISMDGFFSGRLRFAMGSLLGIMFLYIYVQTDLFKNIHKNFLSVILQIIFIMYFLSTVIFNIVLMNENKQVNKLEKMECEEILEYVAQYEKENNIEVNKIQAIRVEGNVQKAYYQETKDENFLTCSGVRSTWSAVGCINFYCKNKFLEKDDEIPEEILDEIINSERIQICINDTLYAKCYMY